VCPDQLYEDVIEVEERVIFQQDKCEIKKSCPVVQGTTGEKVLPITTALIFPVVVFPSNRIMVPCSLAKY